VSPDVPREVRDASPESGDKLGGLETRLAPHEMDLARQIIKERKVARKLNLE